MRKVLVGALALGLLGGCAPKEINYKVNIVTQACDATVDPFDGVSWVRVRVTGDELGTPLEASAPRDTPSRELRIPEIPAGSNRVIEVRGYDGDPAAGGRVLSIGRSVPFTVPDVVPDELQGQPVAVNIFLRKIGVFSPPSSANRPTQCERMQLARAGHTATLLQNGKVYIAGGYNLKAGSPEKVALAEAELFDPATGAFQQARPVSINQGTLKLPKAFHTATRLASGQVLLWGGEGYSNIGGTNNVVTPTTVIVIYDPEYDDYGALGQRANVISRTQHAAAVDANGKVLVVGGLTRTGGNLVPTDKVEWFDPADNSYKIVDGVTLARLDMSVAAVKQGEFIAVAGGTNGTALQTDVFFFKFDGSTFRQQALANAPRLADPGRRSAGVASLRGSNDLLLLGGFSHASNLDAVSSSEVVSTASASVVAGPTLPGSTPRGDICAVTLPDGSVMAIGGRAKGASSGAGTSDGSTALIKAEGSGGLTGVPGPSLGTPRYSHTCTVMADGSVLVLGGVNATPAGAVEILQDAWIYTPPPAD